MRSESSITPTADARHDDFRYWLALHRTPGIGARRCVQLLDSFDSPSAIFNATHDQLRNAGMRQAGIDFVRNPDWPAVDQDLAWLEQPGNRLITYRAADYPPLLKEIPDPPALLFVHGDADYLHQPQLAIVGSRNPSHNGQALAREFAAHLASCGLTITSGLAAGVDAAAHRGALDAGGSSVAVTGTGLDRVYPACHRELAHQLAENGALVSEFPPGTAPLPANFPRRNRIISGLSLGTLVVEAALRSGSLITARSALEQGREVFAIPGSIHNPLARGCHALIREGAKLVETGDHILEELAALVSLCLSQAKTTQNTRRVVDDTNNNHEPDPEYVRLLDIMGFEPIAIDQLVQRSGLTPEQVSSMLLLLELQDRVVSGSGGRYTRTR